MTTPIQSASRIVSKLWSYCHVLRDDGLSYQDYLEQLTFLLFLKMADERATLLGKEQPIPKGYRWADLANPQMEGERLELHYRKPFGKKSSITVVNEEGETDRESLVYNRPDFWVTTSNKQLNFVQHIKSLLRVNGRAAVVLPDKRALQGRRRRDRAPQAAARVRSAHDLAAAHRHLLRPGREGQCAVLRPQAGSSTPWTKKVWVYDHRTNCHSTLKTKPMKRADLDDFVACYRPGDVAHRKPTWSEKKNPEGRWRGFPFEEIAARDKCSLDLFWLRDESLEDSASLPDPHILAQEIADDLRSALGQIEDILGDLEVRAAKQEPSQPMKESDR
jgi:type I restriction enzyme M protein